jgi:cell division protein FtsQ
MPSIKVSIVIFLLVMLVLGAGRYLVTLAPEALPIRYVRTTGLFHYLGKEDIKTVLQPLVVTDFFSADMQAVHQTVESLPWVASATVERVWPDAIDINVIERKPYVRWGERSLLTERGVLFTPKNAATFTHLPKLTGPEGRHQKVLEIMKGIRTELEDHALTLAEFNVNNRWAWTLKLASGLSLELGRNEQLKKLQRFLKAVPALGQNRFNAIATVDLRYPNGFALAWKPNTSCCNGEKEVPQSFDSKPKKNIKSNNNGKKNRA